MNKFNYYLELVADTTTGEVYNIDGRFIVGHFTIDSDGKISKMSIELKPDQKIDSRIMNSEMATIINKLNPIIAQKLKNVKQQPAKPIAVKPGTSPIEAPGV